MNTAFPPSQHCQDGAVCVLDARYLQASQSSINEWFIELTCASECTEYINYELYFPYIVQRNCCSLEVCVWKEVDDTLILEGQKPNDPSTTIGGTTVHTLL